jgi:hypothetical protein
MEAARHNPSFERQFYCGLGMQENGVNLADKVLSEKARIVTIPAAPKAVYPVGLNGKCESPSGNNQCLKRFRPICISQKPHDPVHPDSRLQPWKELFRDAAYGKPRSRYCFLSKEKQAYRGAGEKQDDPKSSAFVNPMACVGHVVHGSSQQTTSPHETQRAVSGHFFFPTQQHLDLTILTKNNTAPNPASGNSMLAQQTERDSHCFQRTVNSTTGSEVGRSSKSPRTSGLTRTVEDGHQDVDLCSRSVGLNAPKKFKVCKSTGRRESQSILGADWNRSRKDILGSCLQEKEAQQRTSDSVEKDDTSQLEGISEEENYKSEEERNCKNEDDDGNDDETEDGTNSK